MDIPSLGGHSVRARSGDVWPRSYPFWDAYFAVVVVAAVVVVSLGDVPATKRAAFALVAALAVAYALAGRAAIRAADPPSRAGLWYAAAAIPLFTVATLVDPGTSILMSALIPQMFMAFRIPQAVGVQVSLLAGPAIALADGAGAGVVVAVVTLLVVIACTTLLGTLIDRLGRQNRERAKLIEELDRTREELAEVSKEAGMLAERERLAGDIHDTIAQGLSGIAMLVQAAEAETGPNRHLALAARTARESLAESRALVAGLAPPALAGGTLEEALGGLAADFPLPVEMTVGGEPAPLPAEAEAVLLRVAQEGLANVRKHAGASSVRLRLSYGPGAARLALTDDGGGFEPEAARGGYGLRGMRSRVARLGGTLSVRSEPGAGATVAVELPCPAH